MNPLHYRIERCLSDINLIEVTSMLHRAYAPLAAAGMNYIAATQTPDMTEARLASSTASWTARLDDRIIGLVSYYARIEYPNVPALYYKDHVGVFAQLAVEPQYQKRGIGYALIKTVEEHAAGEGKSELVCDTAENATHLRDYYARLGFREIATHCWPNGAYKSIIFSKQLNG
ncbi:MAG: GNAT family N-acetyltransferase, partial [Candidatus Eremiobacteraeota bacterium]|nr:GNAT family N-acetyltransferase [Candidatus Eremiobacteraeota bacterium]